jgi:hypothetical protein
MYIRFPGNMTITLSKTSRAVLLLVQENPLLAVILGLAK